jgi:hypothetical protein
MFGHGFVVHALLQVSREESLMGQRKVHIQVENALVTLVASS